MSDVRTRRPYSVPTAIQSTVAGMVEAAAADDDESGLAYTFAANHPAEANALHETALTLDDSTPRIVSMTCATALRPVLMLSVPVTDAELTATPIAGVVARTTFWSVTMRLAT